MNKCIVIDDATDWQQRAVQAEALALTLQSQRDAAELGAAQAENKITRRAIKLLQCVHFILGGDGTTKKTDVACLLHNTNRALELLGEELPPMITDAMALVPTKGGALLLAEIEAARAVVEAARNYLSRETSLLPIDKADVDAIGALLGAVRAYDETMKRAR